MKTFERGAIHPTALVSADANLGVGVTIGAFSVVHDGAEVGDESIIGSHCVLGEPSAEFYGALEAPVPERSIVGRGAIIRSHSVIYQGVTIGEDLNTGHRVTIREGSVIGDDVHIGTMSDLHGKLTIGNHVRLHSSVFVAQFSAVEDFVWLFPYVILTNDPHPPSDTCTRGPTVRQFAVVATNSILMPGVEVGDYALVGATSLVTRNVLPHTVVVGTPAKPIGPTSGVRCKHGMLEQVYPWTAHFRRGYPPDVLPAVDHED